jgi:hypothetical protein
MPFPLIPTALGFCFLLMWAFIGGMIFRDGQLAARRDREVDAATLPFKPIQHGTHSLKLRAPAKPLHQQPTTRAAS